MPRAHELDREHCRHAEVDLVIRDLKDQTLAHSAWAVIAVIAHNLAWWPGGVTSSGSATRSRAGPARFAAGFFAIPD